jgi:signal transduction histidine kinase
MNRPAQSLSQWFYRNARVPILFSLFAFLSVETLLLVVIGKNQFEHQRGVAERLAEVSRLALEEKSTALLQAGFDIARKELEASTALVCEQSLMYVTVPPRLSTCSLEKKWSERVIEVPISLPNRLRTPPFQQHKFVLQVPIYPRDELIYYTLGLSFVVCLLGVGLLRRVSLRLESDLFGPLFQNLSSDLKLPIRELEELRQKLLQLGQLKTKQAVTEAVYTKNQQVAHDIKSPLTALLFASRDFDRLPDSSRKVIQAAVRRINEIANGLLKNPPADQRNDIQDEIGLRDALEELIEEKKMEYFKADIGWKLNTDSLDSGVKSPAQEKELKRALSNLINNSVEALQPSGPGEIELGALSEGGKIRLWVKDCGIGMEPHVLSRVGERGFSNGKARGRGWGVSFAKALVEKTGGQLLLHSELGKGTRIEMVFG